MKVYDVKKMYEWPLPLRLATLILCAIVLLGLVYFLDISSLKSKKAYDTLQVEDLKQQLAMMLDKQVSFSNDIEQLPKLKTIEKDWQKLMIDKASLPALLDNLLKLGESNQLKFTTFDPGDEIKEGIYTKVPVKIIMKGTYDQVASFISQVVNLRRMIFIENYSMTKEKQSGLPSETLTSLISGALLEAELTLEIYSR